MSRGPSLTIAAIATTVRAANGATLTSADAAHPRAHKRYSPATAARILDAMRDLERIEDVITISALARRTGVSRPTVRAILRQEAGWTPTQSHRAHHAGVRRGKLLQAVAGHPGLAQGRATLESQGWPNLQQARQASQTHGYPALQQGRETQAARGWPSLVVGQRSLAAAEYSHLAQGRANLAARGWPNWQLAQDALKAQDYLPLVEAQRLRKNAGYAPQAQAHTHQACVRQADAQQTDRRRARGRTTRLAILEAIHACEDQCAPDLEQEGTRAQASSSRVAVRALAAQLHLHPATVYAHLKQLSAEGIMA